LRDQEVMLDCPDHATQSRGNLAHGVQTVSRSNARDRRRVAVAVTSDGRRVNVPVETGGLVYVSLLELVRSLLLGLDGLLGLITGSRRENGGTRRTER